MSEALSSSPSPRVGRNGSSDGSSRAAMAAARARASRSASSSISSSELVWRISRCCAVAALQERGVDARQRVGHRLAGRALDERGELDQLEVAHDAVGDVEVGVQAQLAQAPAGARDRAQQLVAQRGEGRVQRLVGAEELLVALLPAAPATRRAPPRRTATAAAARRAPSAPRRPGRAPRARASSRRAGGGASRRRAPRACRAPAPRAAARRGSARPGAGARRACAPTAGRGRRRGELAPLRGVHRHHGDRAVARPRRAASSSSRRPASATAAT